MIMMTIRPPTKKNKRLVSGLLISSVTVTANANARAPLSPAKLMNIASLNVIPNDVDYDNYDNYDYYDYYDYYESCDL